MIMTIFPKVAAKYKINGMQHGKTLNMAIDKATGELDNHTRYFIKNTLITMGLRNTLVYITTI